MENTEQVQLVKGQNGLTKAVINNEFARCEVYLHGAQVTSFIPKGGDDLLWLSQTAIFAQSKAIRGGIPLCWPWFGAHPTDNTKAAHGFARVSAWQVVSAQTTEQGATELVLGLKASEQTLELWPYDFDLQYKITVAQTLSVALTTINTGKEPIQITEALHSYLALGDITKVRIQGLEGLSYSDKVNDSKVIEQAGDIVVEQEVDRVYMNTQDSCVLIDDVLKRTLKVSKSGSNDTVVWNPWVDKASSMVDVHDNGHLTMVCIEAANVLDNVITIEAGERHSICQTIG
ncbi:MAG: D-hexose-6-phosphate mutarotase [Algicola sp.]|nr:D-hexose-6-phosphate mutarotase [Algicola sp.]